MAIACDSFADTAVISFCQKKDSGTTNVTFHYTISRSRIAMEYLEFVDIIFISMNLVQYLFLYFLLTLFFSLSPPPPFSHRENGAAR